MKLKLAMMLLVLAMLVSGCGYMLVEDAPVQVGASSVRLENTGR